MNSMYCVIILTIALVITLGASQKDSSELSANRIDRICKKVNKMKLMGQSDEEIDEFLTRKMSKMLHDVSQTKSDSKTKRSVNYSPKNQGFLEDSDDGQRIDLRSKDVVGQKGQLIEMKQIGTDSSSGLHSFPFNMLESNNDFKSSDVTYFTASIYANVALGGTKKNNDQKFMNPSQSRSIKESKKLGSTYNECQQMIQAVYIRAIQSFQRMKSRNMDTNLTEEAAIGEHQRSGNDNESNSTNIETQYGIGPDGVGFYDLYLATRESSMVDNGVRTETQEHENLDGCKVSLINILLPIAVLPSAQLIKKCKVQAINSISIPCISKYNATQIDGKQRKYTLYQ